MKSRVTLTIDSAVLERAKHLARERNASLSALIESYLRSLLEDEPKKQSFARRWAGKFQLAEPASSDARQDALIKDYLTGS